MQEKTKAELPRRASEFGLRSHVGEKIRAQDLKKLKKRLEPPQAEQDILFVHGKGQRKPVLPGAIDTVDEYLRRQRQYDDSNRRSGDRNSFFKTDRRATFMRMKENRSLVGPVWNNDRISMVFGQLQEILKTIKMAAAFSMGWPPLLCPRRLPSNTATTFFGLLFGMLIGIISPLSSISISRNISSSAKLSLRPGSLAQRLFRWTVL